MTRKKWNRLKRQWPQLFYQFDQNSWERVTADPEARRYVIRLSKSEVIAHILAAILERGSCDNVSNLVITQSTTGLRAILPIETA
jgi:hypothetical protein